MGSDLRKNFLRPALRAGALSRCNTQLNCSTCIKIFIYIYIYVGVTLIRNIRT